ncbi:hypothetical protein [Syntrophomonas wolfei]|uniref:SbsA Ig-like domain-containing protein n=1 Tax=Syntrophomonas wolfei subsp. wolfei (strain DSM 2245B / Goettingen) TaxID=335541 RepID=Q0AXD8_SYNWW|nr:hypothetical protein [Syntrophomonas wolfei]ABI68616.1 hypothetical protein Swol_1308 [Syntrophomonas wolfei subsp. wolfei str. Goettingen G311]
MKKLIITSSILFIAVFVLVCCNASYANDLIPLANVATTTSGGGGSGSSSGVNIFPQKFNVPFDKDWTITFNNDVIQTGLTDNIYVLDESGKRVDSFSTVVKIIPGLDKKSIIVKAPIVNSSYGTYIVGWKPITTYTLCVDNAFCALNGKPLTELVKMKFSIIDKTPGTIIVSEVGQVIMPTTSTGEPKIIIDANKINATPKTIVKVQVGLYPSRTLTYGATVYNGRSGFMYNKFGAWTKEQLESATVIVGIKNNADFQYGESFTGSVINVDTVKKTITFKDNDNTSILSYDGEYLKVNGINSTLDQFTSNLNVGDVINFCRGSDQWDQDYFNIIYVNKN